LASDFGAGGVGFASGLAMEFASVLAGAALTAVAVFVVAALAAATVAGGA
jgi:hypothetical protein